MEPQGKSILEMANSLHVLSTALINAAGADLMSRDQASYVWKKYLREHDYLPEREYPKNKVSVTKKGGE